jgi:hypothetical protein
LLIGSLPRAPKAKLPLRAKICCRTCGIDLLLDQASAGQTAPVQVLCCGADQVGGLERNTASHDPKATFVARGVNGRFAPYIGH